MKNFKTFISIILIALIFPLSCLACSNKKDEDKKIFVGIAIYQKIQNNLNWSKFTAKHSAINNIISTSEDKISVDEEPELLFYVYNQKEITSTINDDDFISNTTRDKVKLNDGTLSFRLERIIEDTEILIYYIYKLHSGNYYLEYKDSKNNITNETETIELDITNNNFSKIKLTLETNLTIKDEY